MNGMGTFIWANGDIYTGEWRNNMMHGLGKMVRERGNYVYDGTWINNKFINFNSADHH
jgi:hypothetical protein